MPLIDTGKDPIRWWLEDTQKEAFPNLYLMAIDMLSIPASSAPVERLWSSAQLTMTDRRNRLSIQSVEWLECLKSWRKIESFDMIGQWEVETLGQEWVHPDDFDSGSVARRALAIVCESGMNARA